MYAAELVKAAQGWSAADGEDQSAADVVFSAASLFLKPCCLLCSQYQQQSLHSHWRCQQLIQKHLLMCR